MGAILPPEFETPQRIEPSELEQVMDSGDFVFVLSFPPRFEADVIAGYYPSMQLNVDATAMTQAGNGSVYLQEIIIIISD